MFKLIQKIFSKVENKIIEFLSLDYRSLALLRISMGIIIIMDLIQRSKSIFAHYDDLGILPRLELLKYWNNEFWISIHMASGMWQWQAFLFIIAGIFALMLILGYRTKLAIIVSWFLLVSLHVRNPLILQGGDVIFRVIIFWMMFLPLNKRWSLDLLFNKTNPPEEKNIYNISTLAYIVQVCVIYIFTGILKTGVAWHVEGSATYYALSIDQLVTPIGTMLLSFPKILPYLTWFVLYTEIFGAVLFFIPFFTAQFRLFAIILFAILQIGFNIDMRLGLFGMIAVCGTFGLIPSYFWDTIVRYWDNIISAKGKKGLSIYYDGDCTFCAKIVFGLKKFLFLNKETLLDIGYNNKDVDKEMAARGSWVIVDKDGTYSYGYDGFITILKYTPHLYWIAPVLNLNIFKKFGDRIYSYISKNRLTVCLPIIKEQISYKKRLLVVIKDALVLSLCLYVVLWNYDSLKKTKYVNKEVEWIGRLTRLDQKFDMFAPTPLTEDGWYVFPGQLRDGTHVDVFRDKIGVSYLKPKFIAYEYEDQRWQKYLMNLWSSTLSVFRESYGKYLCREWNKKHTGEKELLTFKMIFMLEKTPKIGETQTPVEPTTIWEHKCF